LTKSLLDEIPDIGTSVDADELKKAVPSTKSLLDDLPPIGVLPAIPTKKVKTITASGKEIDIEYPEKGAGSWGPSEKEKHWTTEPAAIKPELSIGERLAEPIAKITSPIMDPFARALEKGIGVAVYPFQKALAPVKELGEITPTPEEKVAARAEFKPSTAPGITLPEGAESVAGPKKAVPKSVALSGLREMLDQAQDVAMITAIAYDAMTLIPSALEAWELNKVLAEPYKTLGVARDATPKQIKSRYRSLARELHPDISKLPDEVASKRFAEATAAYDELQRIEKLRVAPTEPSPVAAEPFALPPSPTEPLKVMEKATVDLKPSDKINAITIKEAGERIVAGDRTVLPHIQEGVGKFGPATIEDNLINKGVEPALAERAATEGIQKAEVGLKGIRPELNAVLEGKPIEPIKPIPRISVGAPMGIVAPEMRATPEEIINKALGGVPEFFKQDIISSVRKVAETLTEVNEDINNLIRPSAGGEAGKLAAATLRENLGTMARSYDKAEQALVNARNFFDRNTKENNLDFIDKMELGEKHSRPELDITAKVVRNLFKQKVDEVRALGTGKLENVIENYFPHIWKDPRKAEQYYSSMLAKRPFKGSQAFLKHRTIDFTTDGIAAGLEPVSWNPIDLTLLKIREMDKYIMAQKTIATLKDEGLVRFVKIGQRPPEDFKKIDDSMSTVYSRGDKGELILRGHYYAQKDAARILNNYLSKGLASHPLGKLFQLYRFSGNLLNQFQLGFSAFHLGFTSMDAAVSRLALGINEIAAGHPVKGFAKMLSSPIAPITNAIKGDRLMRAWYGLPRNELESTVANLMVTAGARAKMDRFYATEAWREFKNAMVSNNLPGAILRLPFALVDLAAKPILEYVVPRQKLGVFFDMMKMEVENNPQMTHEEFRRKAQLAWDSVDNRMGQLVYDNLFWNKVVKDTAMGSVRSVGWNIGTIRELGGGIGDYLVQSSRLLQEVGAKVFPGKISPPKQRAEFTYRMAYVMALPFLVGIMGAIYQYLRTGKAPEEPMDYFMPKNGGIDEKGRPTRDELPSYMKDVFSFYDHPTRTALNKLQPLNNLIANMLTNRDYYGTEIRNVDDPIMQQLLDEIKFVGQQMEPFGMRNIQKEIERGRGGPAAVLPMVGIVPAPSYVAMTKAERLAQELASQRRPVGTRTKEQAEKSKLKVDIFRKLKLNDPSVEQDISKAIEGRKLTFEEVKKIYTDQQLSSLERAARGLTLEEIIKVWNVATPTEKEKLQMMFGTKLMNAIGKGKAIPALPPEFQ
jgi:hypothetical protein